MSAREVDFSANYRMLVDGQLVDAEARIDVIRRRAPMPLPG